jgi:hypothetical protein
VTKFEHYKTCSGYAKRYENDAAVKRDFEEKREAEAEAGPAASELEDRTLGLDLGDLLDWNKDKGCHTVYKKEYKTVTKHEPAQTKTVYKDECVKTKTQTNYGESVVWRSVGLRSGG